MTFRYNNKSSTRAGECEPRHVEVLQDDPFAGGSEALPEKIM